MDVDAIAVALDALISSCTTREIAVLRRWTDDVRRNPSDHDMQEYAVRVMDAMRNAERHMIAAYQAAAPEAMREQS